MHRVMTNQLITLCEYIGELAGFEAAWHGKAKREMPQLAQSFSNPGYIGNL